MELSQITADKVSKFSFDKHKALFTELRAHIGMHPEESAAMLPIFYDLLEGKGCDTDMLPFAADTFVQLSKNLSNEQINEAVDCICRNNKSILLEKEAARICMDNPRAAPAVFNRLLSVLSQSLSGKSRPTTVLDNTRLGKLAATMAFAEAKDSIVMWRQLGNDYPNIQNMLFSKIGYLYQKQPFLRSLLWQKIAEYKGNKLCDLYQNIKDAVESDSSKAIEALQLIDENITNPSQNAEDLKRAYLALGEIRRIYHPTDEVDKIFQKGLVHQANNDSTIKFAYRGMGDTEQLRSHVEIGERTTEIKESGYAFEYVDSISPDQPSILFLGGSGTKSDMSANGYLSDVNEFLEQNNIRHYIRLYAAIYDFGDSLDHDIYFNDSLARAKLMEKYHHQVPLESKFSKPSEDTLNPRYVAELFNRAFLQRICDENGSRLPVDEACRRMRKITIIAHCHGAYTFLKLEELMQQKMQELGYNPSERAKIQHELLCIAHAPYAPLGVSKSTMISFASADDDRLNHYNNFNYVVRSMPDRNVTFSYFPDRKGELILVPSVGHKIAQHNFIGYDSRYGGLSKEGKIFVEMSGNAVINGIKNSLTDEPLPSVKDLICGHNRYYEKIFDRLEQNGIKMWNRIVKGSTKILKKQAAVQKSMERNI